jgi:hypothetical protein
MDKTLTPEQSLRLIDETIREAKRSFQKIHFYFLLWGILFAMAGIASYVLMRVGSTWHWVGWPVMGVLGGIIAGVHGAREGRKQGAMTTMDRVHMWLWTASTISLLLLLVGLLARGVDPNPYILVLIGMPTFITGALMRFRPLMLGGVLFWIIGLASFFVLREYSSLVFSGAIVLGYIIPGLLLKQEENGLRTA